MKKLVYKAHKDGGVFHIVNRKMMEDDLRSLPKGNYTLTVEKYRKNKSTSQLGYLFACVYPMFLQAAIDAGWDQLTSVTECDAWCKSMFANREIVNRDTAEIIKVPAFKREMTTTDMTVYINQVRDHCAEYFNVHIPEPETQLTMKL